jgi:glycosyltransferase-like protein
MVTRSLRIAMLCHSTNPRGGVAHALAVAESLTVLGHEVVVHAPDPQQRGFPRAARCGTVGVVAAEAPPGGLAALVGQRIEEYVHHFSSAPPGRWDVLHAHDGMGANALIRLRGAGRIPNFVRTVHHLDAFSDPRVAAWQAASVSAADAVACVSRYWQSCLRAQFGITAPVVGNGVDLTRFDPATGADDVEAGRLYRLNRQRPLILSVGGIEERKNPVRLLQAFLQLRRTHPTARLLVVGGASLLDHGPIRREFLSTLALAGLQPAADGPVTLTGPVPDAHLAPLLRAADVLAFPSLREGFGLVVLEALACGTPVVTSQIPPFTEYLSEADCRFADPYSVRSIASALAAALDPSARANLRRCGLALARRMGWASCAQRHVELYAGLPMRPLVDQGWPMPLAPTLPPARHDLPPGDCHA